MRGPNFVQTLEWLQSLGLRCCLASFVVMFATWLVVLCLRNHSAALRHRILCLGLAGVVMLPALVLISQRMSPTLWMGVHKPVASTEPSVVDEGQDDQPQELASLPKSYMDPFADVNADLPAAADADSGSAFVLSKDIQLDQTPLPVVAASAEIQRVAFSLPAIPLWSLPFLAWALVAVVLALRAVLDRLFLMRTLRRSIEVSDERACQMLRSMANDHGIRGAALLCSESLQVPVAVGVLRPAIVLPAGYGKWSDHRLHIVLLHEMMHIGRADVLAQSIAGLSCILFWFNPLVWRAATRMRLERELASDDSVLLTGEDAVDYADHLVEIAAAIGQRFRVPAAASAMATHNNMRSRVSRLMQQDIDRSQLSRRASTMLLLLTALVVTCLTVATPAIAMMQDDSASTVANATTDLRTEATISGDLDADWLEKLKAMPNLEKLSIRRPGTNFRASAIAELKSLKTLHVEDFPLGSPLADVVLKNTTQIPSLRNVTFKATGLTSIGLNPLADSPIVKLSFIDEELVTDDGFTSIGKMQSLESLELNGTPIEAPGLVHLQNCSKLKRFVLLRDRGATERIAEIAKFKQLEDLELSDTGSKDLVDLNVAASLRYLTLRRCGIANSANTLEQLTQLKRISLDNTDIIDESAADVRGRLEERGIELVDITQMIVEPPEWQTVQTVNEATELARRVHRELNYARRHPSFWVKWKSNWGDVASMRAERIRTVNRLKEAMGRDYLNRLGSYDSIEYILAWSPGELFSAGRYFNDQQLDYETYKYGDSQLAWAREQHLRKEATPRHFPRNGVTAFADSLFDIPPQLKVSHQSFWWGTGLHHNITTTSVSPETATYRELPREAFGGEECRVLESAGRSERLWIGTDTGRLRGLLTYIHQGYFTPFYLQPIVKKLVGREVNSQQEFRQLSERLTEEQQSQLNQAWAEYEFESAIPGNLFQFADYREISPQAWFPFEVRSAGWLHNKENEQYYDFNVSISTVTEFATGRTDLKSLWMPLLPKEGDKVQDQRFAVSVDYEYRQDRTAAEIEALVSEQLFKFAESQILIDERRNPLNKLLNTPAFGLPVEGWLGDRPDLIGQPYLLHFWATWCGPCKNDVPILNAIAKNSIVIGVHPSGTPDDEIRRSMADAKMTYPTIVARGDKDNPLGYPVSMFPYCVKVDAKGEIIKHGFLHDVLGTTPPIPNNKNVAANPKVVGEVKAMKAEDGLFQLSLGTKDGIEPHQILDVVRNGERIGQLRVVLVRENQSVGKTDRKVEADGINVGDAVQP